MASACGRRSAAAASRSRRAAAESNENDDLAPAPSSSTSSFAAAAPFSLPPRSPLAAIADPGRNPRSAPATPKLAASTPVGARACAGRDRSSSIWVARRVFDPRDLEAVEVPHFELEEDPAFWKDRNVQVLIRIRPVSAAESAVHGHKRCLMQESSKTLSWTGHPETMFTFDHVACETISQEKLFKVVGLPMVENCMSGYNGCLFAYGQTGSGKTYTMMGELSKLDNDLTEDSGLTPRIFEYLFARIKEEEESRREEKLKYSCKCSFLEIYNEQITDLLEPSSTNLQIREDIKKGVYVENLMECHVSSVKDAMMLLLQGVTNRKMAATNMNSESSRSHSVFTCVIESRWERDSMTHFRFGRLNLVDLAGSERQKSSGAEGDRLKEAANINRSLSTLGLVIMTLVDVANGKTRHVPYRDSRLTFLLQDSLGGNSKTTIVANVSPSICSSSETLSTLKFAQRAKLIQNNAKVNEDASGDVMALQRQIEKLKDELSCLKKQQNLPGTSCYPSASLLLPYSGSANEVNSLCGGDDESWCDPNILMQKVSHLEAVLVGSLRRERAAEAEVRKMEAEIKHLNRLVHLKEADVQRLQTMLKIRDEKLRRLDLLADDLVSSDSYLMDENVALSQEIQLLQQQINENPMLTHFALENMRLIEQLRMLQKYHKQGEREMLLTEISLLRNHFLHILERKYATPFENIEAQGDEIIKELDNCRKELDACLENNVLLAREVNKLRCELRQYKNSSTTEAQMVAFEAEDLIPEINPLQHDQVGRNFSHFASNDAQNQFMGTGIATSSTESLQFRLPSETDSEDQEAPCHLHLFNQETGDVKDPTKESVFSGVLSDFYSMALGASHNVLGEGIVLSEEMKDKNTSEFVQQDEISQVQEKAENTNLSLHNKASFCQKETEIGSLLKPLARDELLHLKSINQELKEKLVIMAEENNKLANMIVVKDVEITSLSEDWEAAIVDLTSFLIDGCRSLDDAYQNIDNMVNSFPQSNNSIGEKVEKAMKLSIEKEKMIIKLQIELQEAQRLGSEVNEKLHILRGATLAITEAQQVEIDGSSKETLLLLELLCQKDSKIQELQNNVKQKDDTLAAAEENSSGALPLLHNLGNVYAEEPLDENQANPKYQPKLKSVLQFVEDKSNQVLSLFSNFEEAQETMEEAERMLSALLKANGEVKLERDKCKEAVEMLLAEKTYLIDELHELEESNSYTVEKSEKIHQQTNECVAEMTKLATLIKGSFQDIHMVTTAELSAIFSEMITFALELRKWISESKSNLVNIVPVIGETDNSSVEQVHHLNANASACELQEVELLCSRQRGSSNTEFHDGTQAIEDISSEPLVTITNMAEGRKEMSSVHAVTDYVSLRREVARKSDIVEGLSFDLKLLQESTSHAKDMKDEADKILTALGKAHRELEMKTSAMENMMEKQKALEGELAENGAALIILRAELEQAQSLSSVLLKENNDLRVLLEEETVKTDGTRNLLEDKVKVVEGLESQILLLNSSEEGCLLLRIKELNNEAKIIRGDKENLQSEVLKLKDKLEMAMALAEENEATAIEARQAAEISKIYAEEKEEEVKILERSVEELEAITGVLEEEVCNLKEEVRGYQLYKQSGTEFQDVVDGMLPVDNTANCDGTENLCSRKCQLQKKLQTEVVALQEARRKIEGLNTEARRKDEEIRQYKDHIAELVMHSQAQSLLFQDKYQELQQVITKHKFGPPESNSEMANAKTEKPSVRTRGSSSPFRCVSSIIQQMNSEKDQELSVARQRIEELEALVTNKQKEICLLMSRLAAVDSMTHDVIRELLGVRIDMTNYSNLLDQEELQKLLIASQQQIEESKAKDMELEMLKKQFGRFIQERDSMFDDMNQRKAYLLESQLLVEQLEQREQMLEAQNEMLQMEKANLQQKIMEMDETIELLIRSNDEITETAHRMSDNQQHVSSQFSRRLAQSDILLSHARHEHSRNHTNKNTRVHRDSHQ